MERCGTVSPVSSSFIRPPGLGTDFLGVYPTSDVGFEDPSGLLGVDLRSLFLPNPGHPPSSRTSGRPYRPRLPLGP